MNEQQEYISLDELIPREVDNCCPKKTSIYVPGERSGKWTQLQHMKYIAFIDYNKETMRSKEKRGSNKFYEEMSNFIYSRNALQCRSHHQKLQEKYNRVNKIIRAFKHMFDISSYKETLQNLELLKYSKPTNQTIRQITEVNNNVQTQTDIAGQNIQFITIDPNLVIIQPKEQLLLAQNLHFLYPNCTYTLPHYQISSAQSIQSIEGGVYWWSSMGHAEKGFDMR